MTNDVKVAVVLSIYFCSSSEIGIGIESFERRELEQELKMKYFHAHQLFRDSYPTY